MSWKVRHQGSPKSIDNLTLAQVVEGLQDERWTGSDEVQGPGERRWVAMESHPQLQEVVFELEEAAAEEGKPAEDAEEQRIDMNPLIDVCLVLLVFFILATSLQVLEKVLDLPRAKPSDPGALKQVTAEQVKQFMIFVQARARDGKPVILIEGKETAESSLERELARYVRESRKTEMVIEAGGVSWGTVVKIVDAAGGAGIQRIHFKAPG